MSITLTVTFNNTLTKSLTKIKQKLQKLPQEAYKVFKDETPVKTGFAKRNTKLKGSTIEANYGYAEVLDKGRHMTRRGMRGSKQAPVGMSKPTTAYIKKRLAQIVKGR
jgi:hypothetical protein